MAVLAALCALGVAARPVWTWLATTPSTPAPVCDVVERGGVLACATDFPACGPLLAGDLLKDRCERVRGGMGGALRLASGLPLDLNLAQAADLAFLEGVGPKTAEAIVAHRRANGPFGSVADLAEVRGIGPKSVERLRPYLTIDPP